MTIHGKSFSPANGVSVRWAYAAGSAKYSSGDGSCCHMPACSVVDLLGGQHVGDQYEAVGIEAIELLLGQHVPSFAVLHSGQQARCQTQS